MTLLTKKRINCISMCLLISIVCISFHGCLFNPSNDHPALETSEDPQNEITEMFSEVGITDKEIVKSRINRLNSVIVKWGDISNDYEPFNGLMYGMSGGRISAYYYPVRVKYIHFFTDTFGHRLLPFYDNENEGYVYVPLLLSDCIKKGTEQLLFLERSGGNVFYIQAYYYDDNSIDYPHLEVVDGNVSVPSTFINDNYRQYHALKSANYYFMRNGSSNEFEFNNVMTIDQLECFFDACVN